MAPESLIHLVIDSLGLAQCLLFMLFLAGLQRRGNPANRFLIAFLATYAVSYLDGLLESLDVDYLAPLPFFLVDPFDLLLGPLIFFYVDEMINGPWPKAGWRRWRHIILPLLLAHLLMLPLYLLPDDAKIAIFIDGLDLDETDLEELGVTAEHVVFALIGVLGAFLLFFVQVSAYLIMAVLMLRRHDRRIRQVYSDIERKSLDWLRSLLTLLTISWFIYASTELADLFVLNENDWVEVTSSILELAIIYGLGVSAMRQPAVFTRQEDLTLVKSLDGAVEKTKASPIGDTPKYAKSALEQGDRERILSKLEKAMDDDRLYLDSTLTLPNLSRHVGASANYISQVINEELDCNFFDFVNRYRIEAVKHQLVERQDTPVLEIAFDAGFNSKSTFNAAFKRFAGMTPTQFRTVQTANGRSETILGRPSL